MTSPVGAQGDGGRMDDETLAELQRLSDEATAPPWEVMAFDSGHSKYEMNVSIITADMGDHVCDLDGLARYNNERYATDDGWTDAQLIAAMRNALPSLLRELGDARAENEKLRADVQRVSDAWAEVIQREQRSDNAYDMEQVEKALGDTRARLAAVRERNQAAWDEIHRLRAALGATDQAGGGE